MRCSQVQNLLPEYVEGALAASQQEALAAHLHACPTCTAEERSYQHAFDALNVRQAVAAPDLWTAFSARLANELSCAEARELIPLQADPSLLANRANALNSHLASCPPCAAESALMGRAVAAMEAVSSKLPKVDLWPGFAARTGNAPARMGVFGSIRRVLSPARNPLAAPILAMAAFAGILFGAQHWLSSSPQHVAIEPIQPTTIAVSPQKPVKLGPSKPSVTIVRSTPPASRAKATVRRRPATRVASAPPTKRPKSNAAFIARVTQPIRPRLRVVAFDPGATPTADRTLVSASTATDSNSEAAQEKVMPEVVQAVALLLDFGDSASDPFGGAQ